MTPQEHAGAYFGPLQDPESLFARRVDLVEAGAARNLYLRREIEEQGENIYNANLCGRVAANKRFLYVPQNAVQYCYPNAARAAHDGRSFPEQSILGKDLSLSRHRGVM